MKIENITTNEARAILGVFNSSSYDAYNAYKRDNTIKISFKLSWGGMAITLLSQTNKAPIIKNLNESYSSSNPCYEYGLFTDRWNNVSQFSLSDMEEVLPWEFLIKGEGLKIIIDETGKNKEIVIESISDKCEITDKFSKILEADILNDMHFGEERKINVRFINLTAPSNKCRLAAECKIGVSPKAVMDNMFVHKNVEKSSYSYGRRWHCPYAQGTLKRAIYQLSKKSERVNAINMIYKMNVPISRKKIEVDNILLQAGDSYFGFIDIDKARNFLTEVEQGHLDEVKKLLQETGWVKGDTINKTDRIVKIIIDNGQ